MSTPYPRLVPINPTSAQSIQVRRAIISKLEDTTKQFPKWHEVEGGASAFRRMRKEGTHGFPKPGVDPTADDLPITTRDGEHIVLRRFRPQGGVSKGVMIHFHGGGWVINSAYSQDLYLRRLANELGLTIVSVDYRLAPEHPFPTPNQDCVDAVLYALSDEGIARLDGGSLMFIAGESAGAHLAVCTVLALRDTYKVDVASRISGLVLGFGQYDLSGTPSMRNYDGGVLVTREDCLTFVQAYLGSESDLKDPEISPLYARDLSRLPPALFLVGTADLMIDDSVFLASRWDLAGNGTSLKIVQEAAHGFTWLPLGDVSEEGLGEIFTFVNNFL
ncbi:hypothetical protein FOPG_17093 [Fusarium oxysporum f. sp. conglutinans race 2 54008]|uniref:Alpha/beta hydrolase fold-3 domain-containing protein n=1 Tax=Fusarium oxysporum f. sp. conglutinans race 2 54008 TaxID=1089457 RepID=X0H418_FUSOX|nr:hypothetical protein FOPG_17093 [Fusarium oxysporum f. sp. conglutinans race 2 54008]KAG6999806.1 Arylesterase [Fusarium oxysporum f. sp. conglutinans]